MTFFKVRELSKKYGFNYAIKDISFELEQGEFFTLIGPSGAGKLLFYALLTC